MTNGKDIKSSGITKKNDLVSKRLHCHANLARTFCCLLARCSSDCSYQKMNVAFTNTEPHKP